MGGKDLRIVGKRQELLMNALVEHGGKLLRSMVCREIGPPHIANEKCISGEDGLRAAGLAQIAHDDANALGSVSGRFQKPETALPELDLVSAIHGDVREQSTGLAA